MADQTSDKPNMEDAVTATTMDAPAGSQAAPGPDYLALTRQAMEHSESFLTAHQRKTWERSLDHFRSQHPTGSKYLSDAYKGRSRLFRPKTRSTVRKQEAACAAAFFSTQDVVNVAAVDDSDPAQLASAEVTSALVNYRLTKTIPWFLVLQGAYQTSQIHGICVSKQFWQYEERPAGPPEVMTDPMTGAPVLDEAGQPALHQPMEVAKDRPWIDLRPPENIRIHEGCDWLDPVNSSPFLIDMVPMYVGAVKERMASGEWMQSGDPQLASVRVDETSSIRQKRQGYDPYDADGSMETIQDHELVWVYENFQRVDGQDLHWWSLGDVALLTEPRPVDEVYKHAKKLGRPYAFGYGTLEAFNVYPSAKVAMLHDLQVAANDIENLRLDNVKLTMHPRTRVRAGVQIDLQQVSSGAPGSVVLTRDPGADVVYDRPPDVTSSAYAEQDRLNVDFDELAGSFSAGSVQTNRRMNETVGGMALLSNSANSLVEYDLRVFSETWVEPVLRQLVHLEQAYETDLTVLALAGKQAQVWQRYGMDPTVDDLLSADLTVTVNVGIGNTDPSQRLQKFMFAMQSLMQLAGGIGQMLGPQALQSPGFEAIAKEIFGAAGYKDASRFLALQGPQGQEDPRLQQAAQMLQMAQQQIAQLQQQLQSKQMDAQARLQQEGLRQQATTQREAMKMQGQMELQDAKARNDLIRATHDTLAERVLAPQPMVPRVPMPGFGPGGLM